MIGLAKNGIRFFGRRQNTRCIRRHHQRRAAEDVPEAADQPLCKTEERDRNKVVSAWVANRSTESRIQA